MGSVSLTLSDGTARFHRPSPLSSTLHLLMLASLLSTNLFALYSFTHSPPKPPSSSSPPHSQNLSLISLHISSILLQINSSKHTLHQLQRDLSGYQTLDPSLPSLPPELHLFLSPHPLPLGPDSRSKISHMVSSIAHSCARSATLLSQFMSYKPYALCPVADSHVPQKLLSRGCEPLPRRRCLSRVKSRGNGDLDVRVGVAKGFGSGFLIDEVLGFGGGGIRIGFDIAGGVGDFAARMAERNVTVVASSGLDFGGFVAGRGVFLIQMSPASRFPFYDSVFDLVRVVNGLDEGGVEGMGRGKLEAMEFLMFDIDRVLRAGGLFWLDNYVCVDDERKRMVTRVIERFGYKKLKWVVGEKAGSKRNQVYLSAVLQKPARG